MQYVESAEQEPQGRQVVLHFIRHGESGYNGRDDAEGYLTEKGREQAEKVAETLFQKIPDGAIIDFLSSDRVRAGQMGDTIRKKMGELAESDDKNFIFHNENTKTFRRLGISDELTQEYLNLISQKERPIAYWLEHSGDNIAQTEAGFRDFLAHFSRFAHKLGPKGPEIHIISIVHSGPSEVFAGRLLNQSSLAPLANGEEFKIEIPCVGATANIVYKDFEQELAVY